MASITKYLYQFAKNDGDDTVRCLVQTTVTDDSGAVVIDQNTEALASDTKLTALAVAAGKPTWDEAELCATFGCARMPAPEPEPTTN